MKRKKLNKQKLLPVTGYKIHFLTYNYLNQIHKYNYLQTLTVNKFVQIALGKERKRYIDSDKEREVQRD